MKRIFLGVDRPGLLLAAQHLIHEARRGKVVDLRTWIVVLPGSRAGRRLLEVLVQISDEQGLVLTPPQITTAGHLPELLYEPKRPLADELVQQLAWTGVLRRFDGSLLRQIIPHPPGPDDAPRWMQLGRLFQRLHRQLASDALNFADVAEKGKHVAGFKETRRWQLLSQIQDQYLRTLDDLQLWDRQTARRVAIAHRECRTDKRIVLVGTVDLEQAMRQMVNQVADQVTALVFAPAGWSDRFDPYGCLIPEAWQDARVPVSDDQVWQVDDPLDQAGAVVRWIAQLDGRYRADEITVGLPDPRIVPQVERQLQECGLPARYGAGRPLAQSAVCRLLRAVADYLQRGRFHDFAALVRHPDLEAWLRRQGADADWLSELDAYYQDHLPSALTGDWLGDPQRSRRIRQVYAALCRLLQPLTQPPRKLGGWSEDITRLLLEVYGDRPLDRDDLHDRTTLRACEEIRRALDRLDAIPDGLSPCSSAAETIRLLLEQVESVQIAPPADRAAIELVGWLELPLDDAPALIVTSFNEGLVPTSVGPDLFLPNALRRALDLDHNARRYARDAYALSVLLAPWRELKLIVGRRDGDGSPLAPSRLLFADDRPSIAQRAQQLFNAPAPDGRPAPLPGRWTAVRERFAFAVPRPRALDRPIKPLSVTAFRAYLACPYRFYLAHVLQLEPASDQAAELDGAAFGTLAHEVLRLFGRSRHAASTDADRIQRALSRTLDRLVRLRFGNHPTAAVAVQLEQLRLRLKAFARWQAAWAASGWRIEHAEVPAAGQYAELVVDGKPMRLSGRIDRIDLHQATGRRILFDYKTSDTPKSPQQAHCRRGQWIDLQLPLYRHLVRTLGIDGPVQLGYLLLPKDAAKVGPAMAAWNEQELAEADRVAADVIRKIRRQQFWPPTEPPPDYSEAYAPICLDGVFGKPNDPES